MFFLCLVFRFLLFLFVVLCFDFDCSDDKGFFLFFHFKEYRRKDVQLVKGIVSIIRFAIPFLD